MLLSAMQLIMLLRRSVDSWLLKSDMVRYISLPIWPPAKRKPLRYFYMPWWWETRFLLLAWGRGLTVLPRPDLQFAPVCLHKYLTFTLLMHPHNACQVFLQAKGLLIILPTIVPSTSPRIQWRTVLRGHPTELTALQAVLIGLDASTIGYSRVGWVVL